MNDYEYKEITRFLLDQIPLILDIEKQDLKFDTKSIYYKIYKYIVQTKEGKNEQSFKSNSNIYNHLTRTVCIAMDNNANTNFIKKKILKEEVIKSENIKMVFNNISNKFVNIRFIQSR